MTDDLAWETVESEVAYTCEGFDVVSQTVALPDGTEAAFDYLAEGDSVVVVPFASDGDVIVIEEWRQAVERVNRGFPAGSVERGDDDLRAAARRELREETGYEAGSVAHLTSVEPANGFSDAVFHYFVARGCEPAGTQRLDDDESIRVGTAAFEQLVEDARADDLRDGRTMLGVLYYQLFERQASVADERG